MEFLIFKMIDQVPENGARILGYGQTEILCKIKPRLVHTLTHRLENSSSYNLVLSLFFNKFLINFIPIICRQRFQFSFCLNLFEVVDSRPKCYGIILNLKLSQASLSFKCNFDQLPRQQIWKYKYSYFGNFCCYI